MTRHFYIQVCATNGLILGKVAVSWLKIANPKPTILSDETVTLPDIVSTTRFIDNKWLQLTAVFDCCRAAGKTFSDAVQESVIRSSHS